MERETQRCADALRRAFDGAPGQERALRQSFAQYIERGIVSMEELQRRIHEKVPLDLRETAVAWAIDLLDTHGVAILREKHIVGLQSTAATRDSDSVLQRSVPPASLLESPKSVTPVDVGQSSPMRHIEERRRTRAQRPTSSGGFQWKKSVGGDDQWYHRRGEGVWYSPDMIEVYNTLALKLEDAFRAKK